MWPFHTHTLEMVGKTFAPPADDGSVLITGLNQRPQCSLLHKIVTVVCPGRTQHEQQG
jgi:hypothetical protein